MVSSGSGYMVRRWALVNRYTLSGVTTGKNILDTLSECQHLKTDDCSVEPRVC